jgi:hypothetical protein
MLDDINLSLIPIDDLICEIEKRFDGVVVATVKNLYNNDNGLEENLNWYKGGKSLCLGLAYQFIKKIERDFYKQEEKNETP